MGPMHVHRYVSLKFFWAIAILPISLQACVIPDMKDQDGIFLLIVFGAVAFSILMPLTVFANWIFRKIGIIESWEEVSITAVGFGVFFIFVFVCAIVGEWSKKRKQTRYSTHRRELEEKHRLACEAKEKAHAVYIQADKKHLLVREAEDKLGRDECAALFPEEYTALKRAREQKYAAIKCHGRYSSEADKCHDKFVEKYLEYDKKRTARSEKYRIRRDGKRTKYHNQCSVEGEAKKQIQIYDLSQNRKVFYGVPDWDKGPERGDPRFIEFIRAVDDYRVRWLELANSRSQWMPLWYFTLFHIDWLIRKNRIERPPIFFINNNAFWHHYFYITLDATSPLDFVSIENLDGSSAPHRIVNDWEHHGLGIRTGRWRLRGAGLPGILG